MKKFVNGVLRDMTPEENDKLKKANEELAKITPEANAVDKVEEFIDRLADIDSVLDILTIAKDIKKKARL